MTRTALALRFDAPLCDFSQLAGAILQWRHEQSFGAYVTAKYQADSARRRYENGDPDYTRDDVELCEQRATELRRDVERIVEQGEDYGELDVPF